MTEIFNFIDRKDVPIILTLDDQYEVLSRYQVRQDDILNLRGGIPIDDMESLQMKIRSVSPAAVEIIVINDCYTVIRSVDFEQKMIANLLMDVERKGVGIGLSLFLNQVKQARMMGFSELTVYAVGEPGDSDWDGYYFWARVGFEMDDINDQEDARELIESFQPGIRFSEYILTEEGYQHWKEHGFEWNGTFYLQDGSDSILHLERYLKLKGIKFKF